MKITRRTFLSLAGFTAMGVKRAPAIPFLPGAPRFAYVAAKGSASGLHVFAPLDPVWRLLHYVPAEEPVALAIDPDRRTLYVLHEVAIYRTLPRGYVSAYRIDSHSPEPALLGVQPLSLSATSPRHFAISPNGKFLIASAQGGGAYNLFPVCEDGTLDRVCGIRKEVGCGPEQCQKSAQPQTVLFTRGGEYVIAVDQGNDTITFLDANPSLRVLARSALPPATGAVSLAIHHDSQIAFVCGSLSKALLTFRYDASNATITRPVTFIADGIAGPLAIHPTLEILYAATEQGVAVYNFHRVDQIRRAQHLKIEDGVLDSQSPRFFPSVDALFMPTRRGLLRMAIDRESGHLHAPTLVGPVPNSQSVAFV